MRTCPANRPVTAAIVYFSVHVSVLMIRIRPCLPMQDGHVHYEQQGSLAETSGTSIGKLTRCYNVILDSCVAHCEGRQGLHSCFLPRSFPRLKQMFQAPQATAVQHALALQSSRCFSRSLQPAQKELQAQGQKVTPNAEVTAVQLHHTRTYYFQINALTGQKEVGKRHN